MAVQSEKAGRTRLREGYARVGDDYRGLPYSTHRHRSKSLTEYNMLRRALSIRNGDKTAVMTRATIRDRIYSVRSRLETDWQN